MYVSKTLLKIFSASHHFIFYKLIAQSMICAAVEVLLKPKFPSMGDSCTAKLFYIAFVKSGLFACLKNEVGSVLHWKASSKRKK